ncbi:MAG TPA: DUF1569 domain-containing protein [Pirellulales bacterium]|nr:DUF1569 domain-containing protein [Pirellulales bacterium]
MTTRRRLSFQSLDEIMPEVEQLLKGHAVAGQWTLGQICNHLAGAIRSTARPASTVPAATPEQAALKERFFAAGVFPDGRPSPAPFVPSADLDLAEEVTSLARAIERFQNATGPYPAHPYLGPLSREEWVRFHAMHAAHHLGFAAPL